jgi:cell division septal protein FtsQ
MNAEDLMTSYDDRGHELLKRAENIRKQEETRLKWATRGSFALYALGWGLGLAGRLFSVEGLVGGD